MLPLTANTPTNMSKNSSHIKIIVMLFLEYAIWGAYLTSMGSFLVNIGLAGKIGIFYAMQGIVSIFMPALIGILADKFIPAQKTLALCQGIGGASMIAAGLYALKAGAAVAFGPLFTLYSISVACFMPTIALTNSVSYSILGQGGEDPEVAYPPLRVFGTIGFIICMLFVNFMKDGNGVQYQFTQNQFITSGIISLVLCVYALTLPECACKGKGKSANFVDAFGLRAFTLFKVKDMAVFFIFSMLLGVSLQITNGFANPFISHFKEIPEFANAWGARNANALISLSQISETLCILLIPFCMKKFGIKKVMLIAMFAWVFRFGLFGAGNPGSGVWMFILSCIVYGVAFDFFNISGSLYVNRKTSEDIRSSAQGLFMLMTNGIGATIGTLGAQAIVNRCVYDSSTPSWSTAWYIFAGYALAVALLFIVLFKDPDKSTREA